MVRIRYRHSAYNSQRRLLMLRRNTVLYWLISLRGGFYALTRKRRVFCLTPWLIMYPDGITPELIISERSKQRKMRMKPMTEKKYNDNLPPPPKPEDFHSEDEYEEAKGYYGSHVGRIRKMVERARADQAKSESESTTAPNPEGPKQVDMNSPEYNDHHREAVDNWLANKPARSSESNSFATIDDITKLPKGSKILKVTLPKD